MNSDTQTEDLLDELDQQDLGVNTTDQDAKVPTITCDSDEHNHEPIREGEQTVFILVRDTSGDWDVEKTFCSQCQVLDDYSEADENELGPSEKMYLQEGFLWELYEDSL